MIHHLQGLMRRLNKVKPVLGPQIIGNERPDYMYNHDYWGENDSEDDEAYYRPGDFPSEEQSHHRRSAASDPLPYPQGLGFPSDGMGGGGGGGGGVIVQLPGIAHSPRGLPQRAFQDFAYRPGRRGVVDRQRRDPRY